MKDYSSYHNDNINNKIMNDGNLLLDKGLNGFLGYDITVNGSAEKAYITSKFTSDDNMKKNIIMPIGTMLIGDLIVHDNQNWLVIAFPESNKIYEHSVIQLCNNTLTVPLPTPDPIVTGYDELNNPIYDYPPAPDPYSSPCIVNQLADMYQNTISQSVSYTNTDMSLTIPNKTDLSSLLLDKTFDMFGNKYHIYGFQKHKTFQDDKGLLIVLAHNISSEAGGTS